MRRKILIVFIMGIILLSDIRAVFSLPSKDEAGHKGLSDMSIKIKKNVGDTELTTSLNS